ncbi:DNA repair protein Rev1 [Drosophila kikkawai]|uniref:DNA repair protein REV1 n=1 Tax=Drosophila kikkawai TaxID=30033 RepID=A0A6P4IPV1_DROKI|nr:DNA repair protein Rev1 [Drosophila kikkawai]
MARDEDNGFGEWGGYFEAKKSKLEEQFAAASDPFRKSDLFQGISIFVNGRTDPSADELKRIMMVHGGTYHHYERSHTTYTIASTLPDVKVRNMNLSKFISAKWVVDCLAQNKIVDYKPYLLFTNQKTSQPRINFANVKNRSLKESKMEVDAPAEPPAELPADKMEIDLAGILGELQQAVVTSPEKKAETSSLSETNQSINNLSSTSSNSNHARTAADPRFLSEFYKNSRLHHIATLGAGFKQYVCELRQANAGKDFPMREALKNLKEATEISGFRYVMHIDMDCFFVSVGLRSHPELRGLPVAVTHSKGGSAAADVPVHPQADRQVEQELFAQRFEHRLHDDNKVDKVRSGFDKKMSLSEIASCSYEAREKGIRNGMFVGQALKLCPELKTIPYDFDGYREVAFMLYNTVAQYTLNIEAVSCDEMFVELTDMVDELKVDVMAFVEHLRQEVRTKTGCPCSAGVGPNKLLARLATKEAKPNGQHLLTSNQNILAYMAPMALETLPGVGSSMSHKLKQAGLNNCGDVQQTSLARLDMLLGKKLALNLHNNCRGIDPRPLVYEQARKTVSAEMNFGIRFTKAIECEQFLRQLSDEVTKRLTEVKRKTKSINLKIMVRAAEAPVETSKYMGHGVCDIVNKSSNLKHATDDVNVITSLVLNLMKEADLPFHELRGLGIHLTKLEDAGEVRKDNVLKQMFIKITEKRTRYPLKPPKEQPVEKVAEVKAKIKPRNVLSMLNAAAEVQKPMIREQPKSSECEGVQPELKFTDVGPREIDPDFLAHMPEEIRCELLKNQNEFLLMEKKNDDPARKSLSPAFSTTPSDEEIPPPPPFIVRSSLGQTSPLNASDLRPSTSRAGLARLQQRAAARKEYENDSRSDENDCRSDQIVADYVKELPKYTHPALLEYINRSPDEVPTSGKPPAIPSPKVEVPSNMLEGDYKSMLNVWISNEEVPLPADVEMIYKQICSLVRAEKFNLMYDVMRHLCRLINAKRGGSCRWHMAYNHIEFNIQDLMMEMQGYQMCLIENIRCAKCSVY